LLIALLGLVLLALLALLLFGPVANSTAVQERIRGFLDQTFGDRLTVRQFHVALLPRPQAVLRQVHYGASTDLTVQAAAIVLYPKFGPLFQGRVEIDTVSIDTPWIAVNLPDRSPGARDNVRPGDRALRQSIAALADWTRFLDGGRLFFTTARVDIRREDKQLLRLDLIDGQLTAESDRLDVETRGRSDLAAGLALQARIDTAKQSASGKLALKGLHTGALADLLAGGKAGFAADLDLALDFTTLDFTSWRLSLQSDLPALALTVGDRHVNLRQLFCRATLDLAPDRITADLSELRLDAPMVDISGTLTRTIDSDGQSPQVQLDMQGRALDLGAVRETALALMESTPVVWKIVQGGMLSQIRLTAAPPTWAALFTPVGFKIEAMASDGRLSIPRVDLALTEVAGWVAYENGTLTGRQLSARCGASVGRSGELVLRLVERPIGMGLALDLEADLSQLPPILKKTVRNPKFGAELERVENVSGQAAGRLRLNGPVNRLAVEVSADSVVAQAEYGRLPYPLALSSGQIAYAGKRLSVNGVAGNLNSSRFVGLTGTVAWEDAPVIDVRQASLSLSCDELYGWFKERAAADWPVAGVEALGGRIDLARLKLSGPAGLPRQWTFAADGTVADLVVTSGKAPAPVTIVAARFQAEPRRLALDDARVTLLDARLSGSAAVSATAADPPRFTFGPVSGAVGPQALQWVNRGVNLPERYRTEAPLRFELAEAQWSRPQGWEFDSRLTWLDQQLRVAGRVAPADRVPRLDLKLTAARLDAAALERAFPPTGAAASPGSSVMNRLSGRIAVHVDRLAYNHHVFEPFAATLALSDEGAVVEIAHADRCGMTITGRANWTPHQGIDLELQPQVKGQRLQYVGGCLSGTPSTERFEGELSISGALRARGRTLDELTAGRQGALAFSVQNGRVTNVGGAGFFTNLLSFLKINKLLSGTAPNFAEKDFLFHSLDGQLDFEGHTVTVQNAVLHADAVNMVAEGTVDTQGGKLNLTVLVSPLNTVDTIVRNIPVVGHILQGTLVAVPVGVSGQLSNPTIVPLSPLAIGSRVWEILTRTLKTPFRLIQPLLPSGSEENDNAIPSDPSMPALGTGGDHY
jgi:hypothetical protein